jgi:YD repeat-containing protein
MKNLFVKSFALFGILLSSSTQALILYSSSINDPGFLAFNTSPSNLIPLYSGVYTSGGYYVELSNNCNGVTAWIASSYAGGMGWGKCAPTKDAAIAAAIDFINQEFDLAKKAMGGGGHEPSTPLILVSSLNPKTTFFNGKLISKTFSNEFQGAKSCSKPSSPEAGNPIDVATGNKFQEEIDYSSDLSFSRFYNSMGNGLASLSDGWTHSFSRHLKASSTNGVMNAVRLTADDGHVSLFNLVSGNWQSSLGDRETLVQVANGWLVYQTDNSIDQFDTSGRILSSTAINGYSIQAQYTTAGFLSSITDSNGRVLSLTYDSNNRLVGINPPSGASISYQYDSISGALRLISVTHEDGSVRSYQYNNALFLNVLTGLVDEKGTLFASWTYDDAGRAVSSQHAGGVELTQIGFSATQANVTLPNGSVNSIGLQNFNGVGLGLQTSQTQLAGSGCTAATSARTYDSNANRASEDDFNGNRSCYVNDLSRNLEITRVKGLQNTQNCALVTGALAALPTGSRKSSYQWHPDLRLKVRQSEPDRITTSVYNGQPDPFNANVVASCVQTGAVSFPDGKPIAVLCKRVEQATTDADGSLGFSAALQAGVANRVTQYTYDASGRLLTSLDPSSHQTTYAYYSNTAFTGVYPAEIGHTAGDLQSVTDAKGFVTTFAAYDKAGRVLQKTDPKGVVTVMSYTPRGWVSTVSTTAPGGVARTTMYAYDSVGQLIGVSNPDGTNLSFGYDAAHRLVDATDARGNSVTYTLDNMGNRIGEQRKDPGGVLQRAITRSFDALNRLQQVSGSVQ